MDRKKSEVRGETRRAAGGVRRDRLRCDQREQEEELTTIVVLPALLLPLLLLLLLLQQLLPLLQSRRCSPSAVDNGLDSLRCTRRRRLPKSLAASVATSGGGESMRAAVAMVAAVRCPSPTHTRPDE